MIKLRRYLKPFIVSILIVIGLLYVQAQTELALPDYMSKIITNGIQAGGFEDAVMDVCSKDTYDLMKVFMSEEDQKTLDEHYTLVESQNIDEATLKKYPDAKDKDIYVLNDKADRTALNHIMVKPLLLATGIQTSEQAEQMLAQLPEGVTIAQAIEMMPKEQLASMTEGIDEKFDTLGESSMTIAASNGVKTEYEALGRDTDTIQNNYIIKIGAMMLGIALLGSIAAITVGFFSSRIGAGVSRKLRQDVFNKVQHFSTTEFNKFSTASLITRTTNDIQQIQMVVVMCLRIIVYSPIIGFGALIKVLNSANSMAWIIGVVLVILFGVIITTFMIVLPKFAVVQKLVDKLNLVMRENLSGMLVIRAFGNEKHAEERFDEANKNTWKVNLFVNRVMNTVMPIMMLVMNCVSLAIVWFGAKQIDLGTLAIGDMMAFMQYSMQIIMSFVMISMIMIMIPRAAVAAKRVNEVLEMEPSIEDPKDPKHFDENKKGYVEFRNVSFSYPDAAEHVLSNISFTAKPGETTAFIGSTGSGKSTLIQLVPRFYDATEGEVLIDGINVKDVTQHDLREKIGLVPQTGVLFSGTIGSNIRYGNPNATDEELDVISDIAQATEFIASKEEKYETPIAQGGTNVSGGQKQRLSIARAIAKNPEIYIFDDSFSALDFKTDAALRKALNELCQKTKSTVLLVGQRISSIMSADQIVVLDEGKIAGIGTHDELMKNCSVYQEIALSQLSKEELGNE
ncbi:ABC transporter ATP-binding protein [Beduini massiliensis]|uniref:ABC transporter ATP-binding protein n=1 Tax=Beduini massiliensis TaxID=1585974 RepID=UPI00059A8086|nr:ABC transporter ATP-binding protein [Beduini massiliensis]